MMNAMYGDSGNKSSPYFNRVVACSVTAGARAGL